MTEPNKTAPLAVTTPPPAAAKPPVPPPKSIGPTAVESRLAALEAAFASLVELHFTAEPDLEPAKLWLDEYQADEAAASGAKASGAADPKVGDVLSPAKGV